MEQLIFTGTSTGFRTLKKSETLNNNLSTIINDSLSIYDFSLQPSFQVQDYPIIYTLTKSIEGYTTFTSSTYLGKEVTTKREGNYISHTFIEKNENIKNNSILNYFLNCQFYRERVGEDVTLPSFSLDKKYNFTNFENFRSSFANPNLIYLFNTIYFLSENLSEDSQMQLFIRLKNNDDIIKLICACLFILPDKLANKLSFTTCSKDPLQRREAIVGIYHDTSKINLNKSRLNDIIKYSQKDTTFIFDEIDNNYVLKKEKNEFILELEENNFNSYTLDNLKRLSEEDDNQSNRYIKFFRDIRKNFIGLNLTDVNKMYSSASMSTKKAMRSQFVSSWCANAKMAGFVINEEQIDNLSKYIEESELTSEIINAVFSKNNKDPMFNAFSFVNKFRSNSSIKLIYYALQERSFSPSDFAYFISSDKWDKDTSNVSIKGKYLELFYVNNSKNDITRINEFLDCIINEKLPCEISPNEMTKLFMSLESDSDKKNMIQQNQYNTHLEKEKDCFLAKSNFFNEVKDSKTERDEYISYLSKKVSNEYAKFLYLTSLDKKEQARVDVKDAFIFDVNTNLALLKKYKRNLSQIDLGNIEKVILENACENLYLINKKSAKDLSKIIDKTASSSPIIGDLIFLVSSYRKKHSQNVELSKENRSFFIHLFLQNSLFAFDKNLAFTSDIYRSYGLSGVIEAIELCAFNYPKGGLKKKLSKYAKKLLVSDFFKSLDKKEANKLNLVIEKFFD